MRRISRQCEGCFVFGHVTENVVGKGAEFHYAAHLHLDMPRRRRYAGASVYYDAAAEAAERLIGPLSQITADV